MVWNAVLDSIHAWHKTKCIVGRKNFKNTVINLVSHELDDGGSEVRTISNVILVPGNILHHQTEEDYEAKKVSPNVDSLIVKLEDAFQTVLVKIK